MMLEHCLVQGTLRLLLLSLSCFILDGLCFYSFLIKKIFKDIHKPFIFIFFYLFNVAALSLPCSALA